MITDPYLRRVAEIESSMNPYARNPNSSARGLFQFINPTAAQYGITAPFGTPEYTQQEIAAAQRFTEDNRAALRRALGREPTEAELYLAHQQGAGGAAKLLSNPQAPVIDVIGEDAALLNRGRPDMTAGEFAAQWLDKFGTIDSGQDTMIGGEGEDDLSALSDNELLALIGQEQPEQNEFADLSDDELLALLDEPVESVDVEPDAQKNFLERTIPSLSERAGRSLEALARTEEITGLGGGQGVPETAFQVVGEGLMGVGDVLGNLAISGYRAIPQSVRQPIEAGAGSALKAIGKLPVGFGGEGTLGQAIPQEIGMLSQGFENLEKESPRTAANLRALGAIATTLSPAKTTRAVGTLGKTTGKTIKATAKKLTDLIPEPKKITSETLRKEASKIYQSLDEIGASVKGNKLTNLADDINADIRARGRSLPSETRLAAQKLADPENKVRQAQDIFESLRDQDLTLDGFKTIDQDLGEIAYATSTPERARKQILDMQRKLRDMVESASPEDLKNPEAFQAYKKARDLWSKQARIGDLELITNKAFATDQPAASLKRALKRFLANKENLRGFSQQEIEAIKKASETGLGGELLRSIAGRLPERIALGAGQPALSPVLTMASTGARSFADDMALRKMANISNLIATGQQPQSSALQNLIRMTGGGAERVGSALESLYGGRRENLATLGVLNEQRKEINERR